MTRPIEVNNRVIREAVVAQGWNRPDDDVLHLVGIRGATPVFHEQKWVVLPTAPRTNRYDDAIGVFGPEFHLFLGTTDPGKTFTVSPLNPLGAAHLEPGRYRYGIGKHRGYPALVQNDMVTVRRDRDRDGLAEPGEPLDKGWYGINIHAGGSHPAVNRYSAGCQVLAGTWSDASWEHFWNIVADYGANQTGFWYHLLTWDMVRAVQS